MTYATKYTVTVDVYTESEEPEIARAMADGKINHLVAKILQFEDMDAVITERGDAYECLDGTFETLETKKES